MTSVIPAIRPNAQPKGRNMIAVASGKGGVGKTWFSITLSQALAKQGKRTLLFDGDLGLANVDIQLGLMPKHDLGSVITNRATLNQAALPYEDGGFDIISGKSGTGSLGNVPANRLQVLSEDLTLMSSSYDHIIIDMGAGVERTIRYLLQNVGTCLVVATDEPTSLTDAYAFIKINHLERPGTDIQIVINMADTIKEGQKTYNTLLKACQGFLKISPSLAGIIRRDSKVRDAIRSQTPILTSFPASSAASDVEDVAKKLLE
ncbi:MAG: MinD/ParA family protein [Rhodospirillales bacterium]|nr:MinD/ParA family protein [Rhodospirillales bacterium]